MDLYALIIVFGQIIGYSAPLDYSIEECQRRADQHNNNVEIREGAGLDPNNTIWVCIFLTVHPKTLMTTDL